MCSFRLKNYNRIASRIDVQTDKHKLLICVQNPMAYNAWALLKKKQRQHGKQYIRRDIR